MFNKSGINFHYLRRFIIYATEMTLQGWKYEWNYESRGSRFHCKVMFKGCNQQIVLAGFAFLKKKVLGRNAFVLPSKVFLRVVCK